MIQRDDVVMWYDDGWGCVWGRERERVTSGGRLLGRLHQDKGGRGPFYMRTNERERERRVGRGITNMMCRTKWRITRHERGRGCNERVERAKGSRWPYQKFTYGKLIRARKMYRYRTDFWPIWIPYTESSCILEGEISESGFFAGFPSCSYVKAQIVTRIRNESGNHTNDKPRKDKM